jgi:hypothetical protein
MTLLGRWNWWFPRFAPQRASAAQAHADDHDLVTEGELA